MVFYINLLANEQYLFNGRISLMSLNKNVNKEMILFVIKMKSLRLWRFVIEEFRFQQILCAEMIVFVNLLNVCFDKSSGGFSILFISHSKGSSQAQKELDCAEIG